MVAGAAGFGGSELAEGVVRVGQTLVVQACRRTGARSVADLQVNVLALHPPSGEKIAESTRSFTVTITSVPRLSGAEWSL